MLRNVLGTERFVDEIKGKFFVIQDFEEVPESRHLAPDVGRIKGEVCGLYEVDQSELYVSRRGHYNEPRNIAIYFILRSTTENGLTRSLRGDSLGEIGEAFGIKRYSTVSSVIRRVKREIRKDRHLKKRVEELTGRLTKGQRQTGSTSSLHA